MSMVNIHPENDDPFYRYKMPKIITKIEGSGNGIKTAVVNMSPIAKALNRLPEYTTKYFGCELGAQVQMYPKEDRWIVNGAHDGSKLQSLLANFIKKFVLCENCDNPETNLIVNKNDISQKCLACGHLTPIPTVHRLTAYITNHPPNSANSSNEKTEKRVTKREKKQKQKQQKEQTTDELKSNEQNATQYSVADDNDITWSVDVSEEASRRRLEALSKGFEDLAVTPILMKSESDRADILFRFVLDNLAVLTTEEMQNKIFDEAKRLALVDKAPLILSEILFSADIINEIGRYRPLLLKFCSGNEKAQKYLLGGIEKIVGVVLKDELCKLVARIFMELYQKDIIDEATFRKWYEKPSRKYVKEKAVVEFIHAQAKPFLTWLDEADEDDSEGDESDGEAVKKDIDVIFTFRDKNAILCDEADTVDESVTSKIADEEGAIDIDAI
ncbi:hypothetical protein GJ496_009142 [Pomphorhynchus laevis]|nr:hypothetical protein GJ496_009142 [Pomphorhynchus laevis]